MTGGDHIYKTGRNGNSCLLVSGSRNPVTVSVDLDMINNSMINRIVLYRYSALVIYLNKTIQKAEWLYAILLKSDIIALR